MVAAGAAIGLGNIWKFPYLAYRGGGGIFLITYIIIIALMAHPMVEMETAIGRHGRADTVTVFEKINPKWGFVGWMANICTFGINMFYVVVGGWVLRYAVQFILSGDFGTDAGTFFTDFISSPIEPLIYTAIILFITSFLLLFGITEIVEKVTKVIMPALFVILIFCAVYACISLPGAVEGLKFYLIPNPSNFNFKVFADAATQVLFSVGIGWGIFTTLGSSLPDGNDLKGDALLVSICDTMAAIVAGFVVIPTAFGAGMEVTKGPALLFDVMAGIYGQLPGGRLIGAFFFVGVLFAVFSSLFSFFEIGIKTFEIKLKMGRKKAVIAASIVIGIGNILCSLGWGVLSGVKLPWPNVQGMEFYNFHDWLDCFTGYVLLPLGCLFTCIFVAKIWGWDGYEAEINKHGGEKVHKLSGFDKALVVAVIPIFMVIVLLNVFGFLG